MSSSSQPDFRRLFESAADAYLVLAPDAPRFTIVAVSDAYLRATMTRREQILGRALFDVFPDPPTTPQATGVSNLRSSLERVLATREPHEMVVQRYDIRRADGAFEERFWKPRNSPVFDDHDRIACILHRVEDLTEWVHLSRQQLSETLESISEAFFALDRDWRFTYVNRRAAELFGRARESLIGRTLWEELPEAWSSRPGRHYRSAMQEQKLLEFDASIDGRHFEFHVHPSSDALAVYINDVTEQSRAALALKQSEARYRAIFDNGMDAVFLTAPDGRIATANQAATELFGYSAEELCELGRQAIVDPTDPRLEPALAERKRTGRFRGKLRMKKKDGTRVPVELSSAVFRDESGAEWTSMFIRDDSAREAREAERERLVAEVDARRRWLEAVIEHVPLGVIMFDASGNVSVNRYTEELLGMRISATGGSAQYANRILFPDGTPVPPDQLVSSRVLSTGETVLGAEFLVERPDGSRVPILGSAAPIRGADGSMIAAIGVFQDVSERMRAEDALRTRERLLSAVFEILPVGLWIADADGSFARTNPAAVRIWGGQRGGMSELPDYQAWWADSGARVAADEWPLARAFKGERSLGKVMRIRTFDGSDKTIVNSALPLYDNNGKFAGAIVVNQDISELKQSEESLRRALRSRDEVLGIVAHDLRNPLNGILLQTELMERRLTDPSGTTAKAIEVIRRQANRMNRLIRDLLDVTRLEAGALSVERVRVPVEQLLAEVIETQRPNAAYASLDLRLDLRGQLRDVWGDRERLVQVFENLIGNALKFTPAGGAISIGATASGAETLFWVADTGAGIPAEIVAHLFDRFWQARRTDKRGAGLGLAIAKGIVEAQGGRLWVESEPGAGSTFFFTVPSVQHEQPEAGPSSHP